jgi:selenide,water dikinase
MNSTAAPIEKNVVLAGAGNAHLVFLKRWGMRPLPGVAVTLVNSTAIVPYSAMVPGHIGGDYPLNEITMDLVRLCQAVKARFVPDRLERIDPTRRSIHFADRAPLSFDVLSLGLGSLPARPCACPNKAITQILLRPLDALVNALDAIEKDLQHRPRPFHFAVVGGGASGCELALAIHKRLVRLPGFRLTLLQGGPQLLPEFPGAVARSFEQALRDREIAFCLNARVTACREQVLEVEGAPPVPCDAVLWATQPSPLPVFRDSGLSVDEGGFLQVRETLQTIGNPAIFGTGDCVSFPAYPDLPRNGVYAVRQGAVLFDNIASFLKEKPLLPFRPQRRCLCLLNTADGDAVLRYGPVVWKSRWARKWKDRIDRAWIRKFTVFAPMAGDGKGQEKAPLMHCGGCGNKVSSDVLSAVLKRIDLPDDPRVLLGCKAGEDAAVHRVQPNLFGGDPAHLVEVQTVDYFKAFLDDPYLFGRIAALNAVSDLYAMNARPFSALAIATLPFARGPIQESMLFELLSGAVKSFRELGVILTGGHTTEGNELALGFAVTGFAEEATLFRKSNLQASDVLVLTKPLGTGALLAAWMRNECNADWFQGLKGPMLLANSRAGQLFAQAGVRACTDVTGFGLAGHLLEMLDASGVSAHLNANAVPLYAGFFDVVGQGIVSSLHPDNAKMACRVKGAAPPWLFDPQTSGGLLGGVKKDQATNVLQQLREAGYRDAAIIGEIVPVQSDGAPGILIS